MIEKDEIRVILDGDMVRDTEGTVLIENRVKQWKGHKSS
jgi:hypothetical protein